MIKKITFLLFSSLIILSCNNRKTVTEQQEPINETPEVLVEQKIEYDISSRSKKYHSDIIQKLFSEAINRDPELKGLTDKLDDIEKIKADSLESFDKYIQNNFNYWENADNYIDQLSDTTLQKEIRIAFDMLESNYEKKIAKHNLAIDKLENKEMILNDYEILMKLIVTEPMMHNYQRNELPDIQLINGLIENYDTLINETKPYARLNK